ncbi:MAG: hemin uptake protein HemP [Pseudomonadota bacterium]
MGGTHDKQTPAPKPEPHAPIEAHELFQGQKEIAILFRGDTYRLRITRNDKLILTK